MNDKKLKISAVIGILFGIFIIWAVVSSYLYTLRKENFKIRVNNTLSAYGSQIDHVYVEGLYVGVYVDADRWYRTDKSSQDSWQKEVCTLIRMDAITSEVMKHGGITIAFFTERGGDDVGLYYVEE
jgi:hypothetical protein